ncbi:MAG: phosphatase PAP2 family protein [Clostridiales bacterium]|nr:phosphatase PAP2 family protein [Clostridiales bacterium]
MNWEFTLMDFIHQHLYNPVSNAFMIIFTYLGEWGWIWIAISLLLLWKKKYRSYGILMLCSLLVTFLIGEVGIKNIVERVRPCNVYPNLDILIPRPNGFSFPSGHAASSFTASVILFRANKKWGIGAFIMASLIAVSRVYLYVHFPTDILAGIFLGIGVAALILLIYHRIQKKKDLSSSLSNEKQV